MSLLNVKQSSHASKMIDKLGPVKALHPVLESKNKKPELKRPPLNNPIKPVAAPSTVVPVKRKPGSSQ